MSVLILALFNASLNESELEQQYSYSGLTKSWYVNSFTLSYNHILLNHCCFILKAIERGGFEGGRQRGVPDRVLPTRQRSDPHRGETDLIAY